MSDPWDPILEEPVDKEHRREVPVVGRNWLLDGPEESEYEVVELSNRKNLDDQLEHLLGLLNEGERQVIEAMVIAGHSIRTTSDILGISKTTVHRLKESALKRLGAEWENLK